jgi:hypothetical protein
LSETAKEAMMPVDERSRHSLYLKLEQVLGPEEATTLMEHLPPVGWADVATKADLEQLEQVNRAEHERLEAKMDARMEAMENRLMATFHAELAAQTRTFFLGNVGAVIAVGGLAVAAARLL